MAGPIHASSELSWEILQAANANQPLEPLDENLRLTASACNHEDAHRACLGLRRLHPRLSASPPTLQIIVGFASL